MVFNLGGGAYELRSRGCRVYNLDIVRYRPISVLGDVYCLPIKSGSLFAVVSEGVLEHIADPEKALLEMERVVRPGGFIYVSLPFLQPFHSCPDDRQRWTHEGIARLYAGKTIEVVETGVRCGPTSSLLWVFQVWLSTLLSLGLRPLRDVIYVVVSLLTFPLKALDFLFCFNPLSTESASEVYILFRKPGGEA